MTHRCKENLDLETSEDGEVSVVCYTCGAEFALIKVVGPRHVPHPPTDSATINRRDVTANYLTALDNSDIIYVSMRPSGLSNRILRRLREGRGRVEALFRIVLDRVDNG